MISLFLSRPLPLRCAGLLVLAACSSQPSGVAGLRQYVADPGHGLVQQASANGFQATAQYLPGEYLALNELTDDAAPAPATLDSLTRPYRDKVYLRLALAHNGTDLERLGPQYIQYLTQGLQHDCAVVNYRHQTVKPLASLYARSYGQGAGNSLLLVFSKADVAPEKGLTLLLNSPTLGTGPLTLRFAAPAINAIPAL
ncbi:hypothetical protein LJ737_11475 [Hymenobacter sp. 15J16-1T3B]|uniref:hypothetical protein n=1 Tax=Hymenobacter sp. 15J16-1T3B TaxID=2886941 RepID=UPI001D11CACB|nr:hypothetical protein [Hymenobacter sp. 15J16-1T3B]MCC3157860.1 hypothetical protein [Hymenobacter sp. 15J16-1T3B]